VVEELASLGERRGWTADEVVAIYEPEPGGRTARVRWVQISGHTYYRLHIAVIDPNGHAAYSCFATMISEAWRVAESNVYGRTSSTIHRTLSIKRGAICGANHGTTETVETPESRGTTA
jgi:hypothetical protein